MPNLDESIEELRQIADRRNDILAEVGGLVVADAARRGEKLIDAGLLMLAGQVDLEELARWVLTGWERRCGSTVPYGPTS